VVGPGRCGQPPSAAGTGPCSSGPDLGPGLTGTGDHPSSPAPEPQRLQRLHPAIIAPPPERPASPDRQASAGS
jgi:hypothetical protein